MWPLHCKAAANGENAPGPVKRGFPVTVKTEKFWDGCQLSKPLSDVSSVLLTIVMLPGAVPTAEKDVMLVKPEEITENERGTVVRLLTLGRPDSGTPAILTTATVDSKGRNLGFMGMGIDPLAAIVRAPATMQW